MKVPNKLEEPDKQVRDWIMQNNPDTLVLWDKINEIIDYLKEDKRDE